VTHEEAGLVVEAMAAIPYFPRDGAAKAMVAAELVDMVETIEQGMWLARRYARLYEEWKGLGEMRAVYCSKFQPQDGLEAVSALYLEGIPSERATAPVSLTSLPPKGSPVAKLLAGAVRRVKALP